MRRISKGRSPERFEDWKKYNNYSTWSDLPSNPPQNQESGIHYYSKSELREVLNVEQHGKCLYCESKLPDEQHKTRIDHVIVPRSKGNPQDMFDYRNLGLSCSGGQSDVGSNSKKLHCDAGKRDQILPFTPYDERCEEAFRFYQNGVIDSIADDDKEVIEILNLNVARLQNSREEAILGYVMDSENASYISEQDAEYLYETLSENPSLPFSRAILDSLKLLFSY